jgi:uncharacterized membrane protein
MPYILMTVILNISILAISVAAVMYAQGLYMGYLGGLFGIELIASPTSSIMAGVALTVAITLFNFYIIYRKIAQISRKRC